MYSCISDKANTYWGAKSCRLGCLHKGRVQQCVRREQHHYVVFRKHCSVDKAEGKTLCQRPQFAEPKDPWANWTTLGWMVGLLHLPVGQCIYEDSFVIRRTIWAVEYEMPARCFWKFKVRVRRGVYLFCGHVADSKCPVGERGAAKLTCLLRSIWFERQTPGRQSDNSKCWMPELPSVT